MMDRTNAALRKRNQCNNQNESDIEENRLRLQKTLVKDKCCQTDIHYYGCCGPAYVQELGDPPLLQQQLSTSKSGIQQIIECFRTGTTQLKHILLKEVDTIFECKLCRSLFRGLPNLITHKEFYCFQSQKMNEHFPDSSNKQNQTIRELLEAIYPRADNQEFIIKLEPIETNKNAVYQHVTRVDDPTFSIETYSTQSPSPVLVQEPEVEQVVPVEELGLVTSVPAEAVKKKGAAQQLEESPGSLDVKTEVSDTSSLPPHLICCLCGKTFNSRRSVRRHIRKVHKKKMEELKKYIGTKNSWGCQSLPTTRGWSRTIGMVTANTKCPVCNKFFASKANVRRHFDEVHRGLRRDCITPDVATKPGQPLSLEESPSEQLAAPAARKRKSSSRAEYNLTACKCLLCKRKYSSQVMLKRHMLTVHKINLGESPSKAAEQPAAAARVVEAVAVSTEYAGSAEASPPAVRPWPQGEPKNTGQAAEKNCTPVVKHKVKQENDSPRASSPGVASAQAKPKKPKLSMGFDFKQLYCKLCKRQFTSKQNLTKHIKMHTDGNNIYVKFYKCPLCVYETRRKRDVVRHVTVVHKKSTRYLGKIIANLESRAVKKPIEFVLNRVPKRGPQRDEARLAIKNDGASTSPVSCGASGRRADGAEPGTEVKFTKHFSLHKCTNCGKAFAKKTYLEHHKKTHKTSTVTSGENKNVGRSTRSKALLSDASR
ncbi:zinc finger protein 800a [Pristis pectinata]|uniref:zinc finger protein 800a n=1 Tax=Pristis pectinata TaxID=685728 RepID=UPI00223E5820|nr:zinc finger protein 800a [Pristis pectinata]XP_051885923.1 zinc finger protein 800a [Pristis pectinata]XP_051885924.1 zinc finger protein 800a [Pristis pectinata]XP_051885925.1 zinc finger protein 800a [Pristis pectinata]